jgi:hypothetical protein
VAAAEEASCLKVAFRSHDSRNPAPKPQVPRPFKPKAAGSTPVGRIPFLAVQTVFRRFDAAWHDKSGRNGKKTQR